MGGDRIVWHHGPLGLGLGTDSPGKTLSPRGEGEGAGRQEMEGLELLVLGKFPWRERWVVVVGAVGSISQAQVQVHWLLFCCCFLFFHVASQFSFDGETLHGSFL